MSEKDFEPMVFNHIEPEVLKSILDDISYRQEAMINAAKGRPLSEDEVRENAKDRSDEVERLFKIYGGLS